MDRNRKHWLSQHWLSQHWLRHSAINILLAISSLLVCIAALEIVFRVAGYGPAGRLLDGREEILRRSDNEKRLYEAVPHAAGRAWGAEVRINSAGFRDDEYSMAKPAGTTRIAVLGDSVMFGYKLDQTEIFSELLEERYRERDSPVEVLNLGISGYGTFQEVATLEAVGLAFHPDLVVVGYCINDIYAGSPALFVAERADRIGFLLRSRVARMFITKVDHLLARRYVRKMNEPDAFLESHAAHISDIGAHDPARKLMEEVERSSSELDRLHYSVAFYASEAHVGHLRFSLEWLRKLSQQHGFKVLVMAIPFLDEDESTRGLYGSIEGLVKHEASRLGFDVLTLRDAFWNVGLPTMRLTENDAIHPNASGHRMMADHLFRYLEERYKDKPAANAPPQ